MADPPSPSATPAPGTGSAATASGTTTAASSSASSSESPSGSEELLARFCNNFRAPKRTELTRKRAIRHMPYRKKSTPSCSSDPKSVTPTQRVREFPKEELTQSAGKLFCNACREELSLKLSIIKLHIASSKHVAGKEALAKRESRERDIAEAMQLYDKQEQPSGQTLPEAQRVYRIKVVTTFLKAGVPLNKLHHFQDLLEERAYKLGDTRGMHDLIPFVADDEQKRIKKEVEGKDVSVVFDGTTRLGEALAVIVRFVDDWQILQRLIRVQLLVKSMTGEEIARELVNALSVEYGIGVNRLLAAMHDRASANTVAMTTIKVLYPNLLDIGCYSHTLDHVGERFKTPTLDDFIRLWISLFSHSPRTRFKWKETTGRSMASYSDTRWWSRWEVCSQVLCQFGDVLPFIQNNTNFSPATTAKLMQLLGDTQKYTYLQLELAAVVDCGEKFVKATYDLEGDGPLVLRYYEVLSILNASIHTSHFPNVKAVAEKLVNGGSANRVQQYIYYGKSCVKPGLDYYTSKFGNDLHESVLAFKAAQFFLPWKVTEIQPTAASVDELKVYPFLNEQTILDNLKSELSVYMAKAAGVTPVPAAEVLTWWKNHSNELPHWSDALKKVLLVQPSSAAAERVFSILKSSFGPQQDHSLQDYVESSLMLQYNKR